MFVNLLGPPVEARRRADHVGSLLEGGAPGKLGVLEVLDRGEMLVDQRLVGQRPEMFGRLELGGIRRQKQQVHVLRHPQLDTRMPASAVQD